MKHVAFFTFGVLVEPMGHPTVQGFVDLIGPVFATARKADGFVAQAEPNGISGFFQSQWGDWGVYESPRFYTGSRVAGHERALQTLSLWRSLEAVHHFSYRGPHAEALRQRQKWGERGEWPSYVVWWLEERYIPTWVDACKRLEHLHDKGATPYAFDFKKPFDAADQPTTIQKSNP